MELTARRHPLSRLGAGPRARVLLLSSFCLIAAVDLWVLVARHARDVRAPLHLRWWLLAALFCLSEVFVVHVQWRSEAHTLSLSEVPLILGLFFASPAELVVGQTVGALVGLAVVRRQGIEKLTFNVANLALGTALAVAVFSRVFDAGHPLALRSSAAALVAAVVASAATVLLIYVAMMLVAGRSELGHLPQALAFGLAVTATNGCLGVLAVTVLWRAPTAVWLLVVPAAAAYYSYRALSAQHERRRRVEVLYETTRIIHEAVDIESAMQALLTHQRDLFRAATAEIVIAPTARGGTPLRMGQADRDGDGRLRPGPGWTAEESALWELVLARSGALLLDGSEPVLAAFSTSRRFADGMVVALRGESRPIGMMLVADRLGAVAAFDENDLALFDTVAGHLSTALEHGRLEHSLEELRRLEEQLAYQARHDPLTGLPNRSLLAERLEQALAGERGPADALAVLLVDLHDFKTVNEGSGHGAGDELLVGAAARISGCLRPTDTAARLGADEFAVVVDGVAGRTGVAGVARRVLAALARPITVRGSELVPRATIGIAVATGHGYGVDDLLRDAHTALHAAKTAGTGGYEVFRPSMGEDARRRHAMKGELERAVHDGQFRLHYQPIVDLATSELVGTEALVRWDHPERGLILPSTFVPLAEDGGLMPTIGAVVLRQACRQAATWSAAFSDGPPLQMTVNLSVRQFQRPGLVDEVADAVVDAGLDPRLLILEVTESIMMAETSRTLRTLGELRQLGVRFALDDFGTGYSSLEYLRRMPIDILKIAKPFVDNLGHRGPELAIATAITTLGHTLDLAIIAEGIERPQQAARLRRLGCEWGQGYWFGRPAPAHEIEAMVRRREPVLDLRRPTPTSAELAAAL